MGAAERSGSGPSLCSRRLCRGLDQPLVAGGKGVDPWGRWKKSSKCLLLRLVLWKHPKTRGVSSQAQPGLPP